MGKSTMCSKFSIIAAMVVVASAAVPLSSAGAVSILNGSFEIGVDPGSFTNLNAGSTNITDWTIASGNIDYIGDYWTAADGSDQKTLQLSAGVGTNNYTFDISGHSLSSMGWVFEHFFFTADGGSDTLTFASLTTGDSGNSSYPNAFGPALDNVSISPSPLPSTWTMLFMGFIGLGFFAYRGTKKGSAAMAAA
jgi:hypothetical protein